MMSMGNQKFGIPRKYQDQIGIWYFCPEFLDIFLVFYRYFENAFVKIWLNIGIFGRMKIGLVFGFCDWHFIGIGLVLVYHFPENDISSRYSGLVDPDPPPTPPPATSACRTLGAVDASSTTPIAEASLPISHLQER